MGDRMSGEIKAGDLVRVALPLPCCGNRVSIGEVYYVARISETPPRACQWCGEIYGPIIAVEVGTKSGWDIRRLKRIDPPALDETTETDEELTV